MFNDIERIVLALNQLSLKGLIALVLLVVLFALTVLSKYDRCATALGVAVVAANPWFKA